MAARGISPVYHSGGDDPSIQKAKASEEVTYLLSLLRHALLVLPGHIPGFLFAAHDEREDGDDSRCGKDPGNVADNLGSMDGRVHHGSASFLDLVTQRGSDDILQSSQAIKDGL